MSTQWEPFLAFEGISGAHDKNGIETVQAAYFVQTLREARFWFPPDLAETVGLPMRPIRTFQQEWGNGRLIAAGKDGAYKVVFTLDGITNPLEGEMGMQFETDGTASDEPAESHPDILFLKDKYDGVVEDGRLSFPPTISAGGSQIISSGPGVFSPVGGAGALAGVFTSQQATASQSFAGSEIANPLYGFKKWKAPGLTWTRSYATLRPPADLTRRLGKVETPPRDANGYLPTIPEHRTWLKVIGKASQRGNVYRVVETWMCGTWNRDVYR